MSDDQFTKLSRYMQLEFGNLRQEMQNIDAKLSGKIDNVYTVLDGITKRLDDHEIELVAIKSELHRHGTWIKQVAHHTGAKLVPKLD